jgi:hypothetical protein
MSCMPILYQQYASLSPKDSNTPFSLPLSAVSLLLRQ